jgi:hypothetical protein
MFDANYFRTALPREIEATGGSPVVEVALLNGHVHRVRAVTEIADGYVVFAAHQSRGDLSHERPRFGAGENAHDAVRVAVSYDSIAAVAIDPAPDTVKARPGFAS